MYKINLLTNLQIELAFLESILNLLIYSRTSKFIFTPNLTIHTSKYHDLSYFGQGTHLVGLLIKELP